MEWEQTEIFQLQRKLFNDPDLRAKCNAEWRALRDAERLPIIDAIKRTRDEWLKLDNLKESV